MSNSPSAHPTTSLHSTRDSRPASAADHRRAVRIANCSGFFGDRLSAAREQVEGGPIDVLTGDWLAELTMLILARQRLKHGAGSGYARTFLSQMEQVLSACLERGIKVVSNAGGLDPQGLADALAEMAEGLGLRPRIAVVTGDDLTDRIADLRSTEIPFTNLDTGQTLDDAGISPLTASAYTGGRGITEALSAGADVVITGRVTDAALVIGPAAWWHDWDYQSAADELAGALVAGHVIECGAQATGGNYSFFTEIASLDHPGFPIAEVAADGSSVITKHAGTGGQVSLGTVTAQLLYELGPPAYANPDVTARFDTIVLSEVGSDRVEISGVRGEQPPADLKVSLNYLGGFRNSATLVLTGLDLDAKAELACRTILGVGLDEAVGDTDPAGLAARSRLSVSELTVDYVPRDTADATTTGTAQAHLHLTVKDADPKQVGRAFTGPIVEGALASYPGFFPTAPPASGTPFGVYWPTTVPRGAVDVHVALDGKPVADLSSDRPGFIPSVGPSRGTRVAFDGSWPTQTRAVALGELVGARSGDKGGNANVGVWVPDPHDPVGRSNADDIYDWLVGWLTAERVGELLPEAAGLPVDVFLLPNLRAVNVVLHGLLGRGVSDSTRLDPQAKGLGEQLRARWVEVPEVLL